MFTIILSRLISLTQMCRIHTLVSITNLIWHKGTCLVDRLLKRTLTLLLKSDRTFIWIGLSWFTLFHLRSLHQCFFSMLLKFVSLVVSKFSAMNVWAKIFIWAVCLNNMYPLVCYKMFVCATQFFSLIAPGLLKKVYSPVCWYQIGAISNN